MLSECIAGTGIVFANTTAIQQAGNTSASDTKATFKSYFDKGTSKDVKAEESVGSNSFTKETKADAYQKFATKTKDVTDSGNSEDVVNETAMSQVVECIKDVIQDIKKTFNLSTEELNAKLQDLGLGQEDILTTDGLSKLLTSLSQNGDIASLLTDEQISQGMKEIFASIESLKETLVSKYSMSEEEIQGLIDNIENFNIADESSNVVNLTKGSEETKSDMQSMTEVTSNVSNEENVKTLDSEGTKNDDSGRNSENLADSFIDSAMSKLTQAVENITTGEADAVKIIKQITDGIKLAVKQNVTQMEMQLYPEELGRISLQVMSKEGAITAHITAQNASVKEAIESQIFVLKESLEEQGIEVETIEVTIASHEFDQNSQSNNEDDMSKNSSRKSKLLRGLEGFDDEETPQEEKILESDATVSYSA